MNIAIPLRVALTLGLRAVFKILWGFFPIRLILPIFSVQLPVNAYDVLIFKILNVLYNPNSVVTPV